MIKLDFVHGSPPVFRGDAFKWLRQYFCQLIERTIEAKSVSGGLATFLGFGETITIMLALTAHRPLNMLKGRHDIESLIEPMALI
ncbi:hypothetical protein CPA45_21555 [Vreelandella nigrificans]|uniref:Uncharacterized protein n=1 Tax=Vreelandella nigrificans TaxID=2042704 RepID=A0A2A4HHQ3_9GAMM|nr:hypothetical protein CPA45_21555 [Halomonas nigrificans]